MILIVAHSPCVVLTNSLSYKNTSPKEVIEISFNLLLIIIGAVVFEVRFKFCKYIFTELISTTICPSLEAPVIKYSPAEIILASVPSISTPVHDDEGPYSSKVIIDVYSFGSNVIIIGIRKQKNIFHLIISDLYINFF